MKLTLAEKCRISAAASSPAVSGFLSGPGVDFSNGDLRTFAGEQDCGGTANPVTDAVMKATLPASLGIDLSFSTANSKIA